MVCLNYQRTLNGNEEKGLVQFALLFDFEW